VHLPLRSIYNGALAGDPDAGAEMHFSFFDLVAHIARTRAFCAGTILGSGTVSNADRARGVSCLAERRAIEIIDGGRAVTPFMATGDTIAIEMRDDDGRDIFGRIDQRVVAA
jgi:fumarylacetoacetate (FAA) hydrolase